MDGSTLPRALWHHVHAFAKVDGGARGLQPLRAGVNDGPGACAGQAGPWGRGRREAMGGNKR